MGFIYPPTVTVRLKCCELRAAYNRDTANHDTNTKTTKHFVCTSGGFSAKKSSPHSFTMARATRVAVYVGTFNPFHQGHLEVCQRVLAHREVGRLVLVINPVAAHKHDDLAPFNHRREMVIQQTSMLGHRFSIMEEKSAEEAIRTGNKQHILATAADADPFRVASCTADVCGSDYIHKLHQFGYQPGQLVLVCRRVGIPFPPVVPPAGSKVRVAEIGCNTRSFSSTKVRRYIREGGGSPPPVSLGFPAVSQAYALKHHLYPSTWSCAIDFGGTSTKWLVCPNWDLSRARSGRETGPLHNHLWETPEHVAQRLIGLLVSKGAKRITHIGITVSGDVEPTTMRILRSDRMNECFKRGGGQVPSSGFDLCRQVRDRLLKDDVVGLCNDSVAVALGGAIAICALQNARHAKLPGPLLVVTLGSWPHAAVVESKAGGRVGVYRTPFTMKTRIATSTGLRTINEALNNQSLKSLKQPCRRSRRVGRSVCALLATYYAQFKWQPARVILLGGNSCGIERTALVDGFNEEVQQRPHNKALSDAERSLAVCAHKHRIAHGGVNVSKMVFFPETYNQQSRLILRGAVMFAELQSGARIDIVSI